MSPSATEGISRPSAGLEQYFQQLQGRPTLSLLDLSPVSQANVSFLAGLGHRLYCEDFLSSLDDFFGGEDDFYQAQENPARAQEFMNLTFRQMQGPFHGALVWDCLQYLSPTMLELTVAELHRLMEPGSLVLTFFHNDERAKSVPASYYRIQDYRTLSIQERGRRTPYQFFTNPFIERVFRDFSSVKMYLTRDHLREIVVKR